MQQFTINKSKAEALVKSGTRKMLPVLIIACIAGGSLPVYTSNQTGKNALLPILIIIPIMAITLFFSVRRGLKRNIESLGSYVLTIDDVGITRHQQNMPPVTIQRNEVSAVIKKPNGSYFIKGKDRWQVIYVPAAIEDAEKLEQSLANIHPLTTKDIDTVSRLQPVLVLLPLVSFVIIVVATTKWLVGIAGSVGILMLLYSFVVLQKTTNADSRTKRSAWWSLLVVGSIAFTMYYKLRM